MRILRALIKWPCLYGSMHLVNAISLSHHFTVYSSPRAVTLLGDRARFPPCHLPHRFTVPFKTNMPIPCLVDTWCATVTLPCHRVAAYRNVTLAYFCSFTHLAYFTTHLTVVYHTSVIFDCLTKFYYMVFS